MPSLVAQIVSAVAMLGAFAYSGWLAY